MQISFQLLESNFNAIAKSAGITIRKRLKFLFFNAIIDSSRVWIASSSKLKIQLFDISMTNNGNHNGAGNQVTPAFGARSQRLAKNGDTADSSR